MAISEADFNTIIDNVQSRNCVPFVGADVGSGIVSAQEMSRHLAVELGCAGPDLALVDATQRFELERGRSSLVRKMLDWLGSSLQPAPLHHLLAELPFSFFFTTAQHQLLEQALRAKGREVDIVVRQEDTAYLDTTHTTVVKLLGDVGQPDTLVLTKKDRRRFLKQSPLLADFVKAKLATHTLLFLEYDLADEELDSIFFDVVAGQGRHKRSAYAVWPRPDVTLQRYWAEENVHFIDSDSLSVLQALHRELSRRAAQQPAVPPAAARAPVSRRPFVFLDAYQANDADLFAGRQHEIATLSQKILAHRLVVLTGASGTGKTSLLHAGVGPNLGSDWRMVTVRPFRNPLDEARRALQPLAAVAAPAASLKDLLLAAETAIEQRLVVVFDQFEELFLYSGEQTREDFVQQLAECVSHADLDTRFVISVRDDYFVRLGAFEGELPGIFHNVFILKPLEREQAHRAVLEPLHRLGLDIDASVLNLIIRELGQQKTNGQTAVDPPQLQIVLDQLYDEMLQRGDTRITQADYDKLGGVAKALPAYLRQVLARQPQAKAVLEALVGEGGTKTQRSLDDVRRQLPDDSPDPLPTLEMLTGVRLVRPIQVGDEQCYELAHDVLAAAVWAWLSTTAQEAARARGLLERGLSDWRTGDALLDPQRLDFVAERAPYLGVLDDDAKRLLLHSAVSAGHDVTGWLERLADPPLAREVLLSLATSDGQRPAARQEALVNIERVAIKPGDPEVQAMLQRASVEEAAAEVRLTATWVLYRLDGPAAVRYLSDQVQNGSDDARPRALAGLAELADADPMAWKLLKDGPRPAVARHVARRRLSRHRGQVARRVVGAIVGAGIGLAVGSFLRVLLAGDALVAALVAQFALFIGAVAGLVTGLGLILPTALANRDWTPWRVVFGGLAGAAGYALAILLESRFYTFQQPVSGGFSLIAGIVTGLLIGLGVGLAPSTGKLGNLQAVGGAVGGAAGLLVVQTLGLLTDLTWIVALVTGAIAGGLLGAGLVMADRLRIVLDRPNTEEG